MKDRESAGMPDFEAMVRSELREQARRLDGPYFRQEAEDLAQDTIVNLLTAWRRGGICQVEAFARATCRNAVTRCIRQGLERRAAEIPLDRGRSDEGEASDPTYDPPGDPTAGDPHVRLEFKEFWDAYHQGLSQLPERQRTAFVLRYDGGMAWAQVGEYLGVSPDAARMLACRGLSLLKRKLKPLVEAN